MFDNFIYYIIVLLIYSTYRPSEKTNFEPLETVFLFFGLVILFAWFTRQQFVRIEKRIPVDTYSVTDHRFSSTITMQSVIAIAFFVLNIYGLNLTSFFVDVAPFRFVPTLQALIFIGLFVSYLSIIWYFSYRTYQTLYASDMTRKSYIVSKISISVPVLLPWILISGSVDIINILPFHYPKRFLSTPEGEVTYFLVFLVGVAITGPAMIQRFWRCKPLEPGPARRRVEDLCRRARVEYANILYWPIFGGRMITAGVMGLIKKFRYILVTEALLQLLDPEEVDAVVAHEIGHVKRRHLLFYLIFFIGYLLLSFAVFDLVIVCIFYLKPVYRFIQGEHFNQVAVTSVITSIVMIIMFLFYFRFIFGYFMRNFERQADIYVYSLLSSAQPLISTLKKIAHSSGQSPDKPNWHHFSINERIAYLEKCESDDTWISRQNRKIRNSILIYIGCILIIGGIGYHLNFGETGRKLNTRFLEKIIHRELERNPKNAHLYTILGDLYYRGKAYEKTVASYAKAIILEPRNTHALNNLAWLYATCENKRFRDPKKAVILAERAVLISPSPHILDTLAESYFAAGMINEAILTEQRALELDKKNRSYYEGQLNKFRKAAEQMEIPDNN
jgi:Zn-dependent protease with chaperone function